MQAKTELAIGLTGAGVAVTPKVLKIVESAPWYESNLWVGFMAGGAGTLLLLSIALTLVRVFKELKKDKE